MPDSHDDREWLALLTNATKGDFENAVRLYDEYIDRDGNRAEAYYKRAVALNTLGRLESALADYDRAIALNPRYAHAFCNRGSVLERLNRKVEALGSYDAAIGIDRNDYLSHYNRGTVLRQFGRLDEALASFDQAILLKRNYAEAYVNRGNILQELWRHEEAIESFETAIQMQPLIPAAFQGRGTSLHQLKRYEAAIESFGEALRLNPQQKFIAGVRRYIQMQICDWDSHEEDVRRLALGTQQGAAVSPPFAMLALIDAPSIHRTAAETWTKNQCSPDRELGPIGQRRRGDKLRIGYFSADFRDHPVANLTAEVFEHHDRSAFEITAFAFGPPAYDSMRVRLEGLFDRFVYVGARPDLDVAVLAREFKIDVAVDLGGLTEHSRTRIFALRAAPVQINYLGYPGTTGAGYMDYVIADRTVLPASRQDDWSETIIYLPDCYLPSDSVRPPDATSFSREQLRLPEKAFVLCCFNSVYKVTPDSFAGWMRILRQVEGSVLWLAHCNSLAANNLRLESARQGVAPERLIFADRIDSLAMHRARLGHGDLFLDTFPYNAHATALDALWAGLPVLTRIGEAFAGRVGASLLLAIGLPELIAATQEQYEELAVALCKDPSRMAEIRRKLLRNRASARCFDVSRFTANLEAAYSKAFDRYLQGLPPSHLQVDPE